MDTITYLEFWSRGEWRRIGWDAATLRSKEDLQKHGLNLSETRGGWYRLVTDNVLHGGPPVVVHDYPYVRAVV